MRFLLVLGVLSCPVVVQAECMVKDEMPLSLHYTSGSIQQGLALSDGVLHSVNQVTGEETSVFDMQFGLYATTLTTGSNVTHWDWGDQTLVAAQDLPVGQKVDFDADIVSLKSTGRVHVSFQSLGPEELVIDGCTYPVVHLTRRYDFDKGMGAIAGELWVEPVHMLSLKQEMDRIDSSGAVVGHKSSIVDEITTR